MFAIQELDFERGLARMLAYLHTLTAWGITIVLPWRLKTYGVRIYQSVCFHDLPLSTFWVSTPKPRSSRDNVEGFISCQALQYSFLGCL